MSADWQTADDLPLKSGVLVAMIKRDGHLFLPGGGDSIQCGDDVAIITNRKGFSDICNTLEESGRRPLRTSLSLPIFLARCAPLKRASCSCQWCAPCFTMNIL